MPQNQAITPVQNRGSSFKNYLALTAGVQAVLGAVVLDSLVINTGGATNVITLYDGTSTAGTLIGIFNGAVAGAFPLGYKCATGIFVVCAAGTPANFTVAWH